MNGETLAQAEQTIIACERVLREACVDPNSTARQ